MIVRNEAKKEVSTRDVSIYQIWRAEVWRGKRWCLAHDDPVSG